MKFTPEDYTVQWIGARLYGRAKFAKKLLTAAKETFREALDTRILEAIDHILEHEFNLTEESLRLWNAIKSTPGESHTCVPPHPCRICCERAALLSSIALHTGAYKDSIYYADKLLALNSDDDITALLLRKEARVCLAFTEIGEDSVCVLTSALADFERASELVTKLPDGKIHYFKSDRDHPEFVAKKNQKLQFVQNYTQSEPDAAPLSHDALFPFGSEPMTVDTFNDTFNPKPFMGLLLLIMDRPEEALPLCKEGFEAAREVGSTELIVTYGLAIGNLLLFYLPEPDPATAFPYLTKSLAVVPDDEDWEVAIARVLARCLSDLDGRAGHKELAEIKCAVGLLENRLERATQTRELTRIARRAYTIGLMHLRLGRSDKALRYFIQGLRFFQLDKFHPYSLWRCFIECLSDLKQQGVLEESNEINSAVLGVEKHLEGTQTENTYLIAAAVFARGLRFFQPDEIRQYSLWECFIECLSDWEQEEFDKMDSSVLLLEELLDEISFIAATIFAIGRTLLWLERSDEAAVFLKEAIQRSGTTRLDAYIETRILQLFCECLINLEPERTVSLLEQLIEWAGADEERVDIVQRIDRGLTGSGFR